MAITRTASRQPLHERVSPLALKFRWDVILLNAAVARITKAKQSFLAMGLVCVFALLPWFDVVNVQAVADVPPAPRAVPALSVDDCPPTDGPQAIVDQVPSSGPVMRQWPDFFPAMGKGTRARAESDAAIVFLSPAQNPRLHRKAGSAFLADQWNWLNPLAVTPAGVLADLERTAIGCRRLSGGEHVGQSRQAEAASRAVLLSVEQASLNGHRLAALMAGPLFTGFEHSEMISQALARLA